MALSVDSAPTHGAFQTSLGGIPYPMLADFHPKGEVAQAYGIWNEERGMNRRAVFIIDKEGIVRFKQTYEKGIPDAADILAEMEKLG